MAEPERVQCGWCPVILPNDYVSWYAHFATDHNMNGYSIRHDIKVTDWDVAELQEAI